ncbi:SusC/RagA family TonB-linked outer membrane protein, partial [Mariniphaga sediminis]|uniref:SusC/RagA family TonB-linked outer membrane protein n=1 Tax=Mariniphaga sediminis TaxID=1628158 RepID=UPI0035649511
VSGKVTDSDGLPLPGVAVVVKGTTQGTVTNADGEYSLANVPEGAALVFSFVGMRAQEVAVGSQSNINIRMLEETIGMDEVVVVGYGVQKKSDITGSVASVSDERLDLVPNRNIAQALQGALPGIVIQQTSAGAVGDQAILIRGRNSILADNEPLIVLDGIPYYGDLNDINVADVKSMEVLKDASAAAIYGSRGSNGVILITTKSGTKGKPKINYQGKYGMQQPINLPNFLNGEEFYEFKSTRDKNNTLMTDTEMSNYQAGVNTNWIDLVLRDGSSQNHNLSVSGGNDAASYFIGGNFTDVKGLSITDDYQRISGRVNLDVKINEWLSLGTRSQYTYDDRSGYEIDFETVFEMNPLIEPYHENGEINLYPWPEFPDVNPLEALNYDDHDYSNQLVSNNFIEVRIPFLDDLKYRLNYGIRRRWFNKKTYGGSEDTEIGIASSGYAYLSDTESKNDVVENIISYQKDIDRHSFALTAVYSYERNNKYSKELEAVDFPNDLFSFYGISQASSLTTSNDFQKTVLISQMLRVNYSLDNKYLLTLTGRRDGYSGFGTDNKWGIFPSLALGWNMANEPWLENSEILTHLKPRISWGINGNQAVAPYASITRMKERNTLSGNTTMIGYVPSVIGDDNLGWESSETINLGLDFGLYKNRIQGDLNIYQTNTSDLLLQRTISSVHGINSVVQNIGKTQTNGVELALSAVTVSTKEFNWKITGNLAYNKNKIASLYGELDEEGNEINDLANAWFIGKPIRVNYGLKMIGVWQLDEASEAEIWDAEPGHFKIEDVNNDDKLDDKDRQIIGQIDPKFTWGLSNSLAYNNFNLEIFLQGSHGATKRNNYLRDNTAAEIRRNVMKKDWWTESNPTNKYPQNAVDASMGGYVADIYEKAGFVRLKDVSLSYNFSEQTMSDLRITQLKLFLTARNLATITNWTGGDPELETGFDAGIVPLQREFVLGINLTF